MPADTTSPVLESATAEPNQLGFDADALRAAIGFAETEAETPWPRDLDKGLGASGMQEPPPWNEVLGPTKARGGPAGVILRGSDVAGTWGDPKRVDMTFSVAKSYLSILAGLALQDGLIRDLDDTIHGHDLDDGYAAPQNQAITWRHMLTQTSEWEGELWSKPDLVDRHRQVGVGADNSRKGTHRDLQEPGTFWEYNDVRVNRLSLSLMQLFKRPLPLVLKERIMDPIGASDTWTWHGYRNSWIEVENVRMQAVPGGTHWGGGLWISAEDQARLAVLFLQDGTWDGQQILPPGWIDAVREPCAIKSNYGLLWWLNTGREHFPNAPESSYFAIGAGTSIIWIDNDLNLAVVARWIDQDKIDDFIGRVMASLR